MDWIGIVVVEEEVESNKWTSALAEKGRTKSKAQINSKERTEECANAKTKRLRPKGIKVVLA